MVPKSPWETSQGERNGAATVSTGARLRAVHLRPPSIDKGVQAFLWAAFFFLYLWLGMLAVGVSPATAFIFAAILAFGIFLFVRIYGEEASSRGRSRARIR
jgi:hypothetical protein